MTSNGKLRVLIVDDTVLYRRLLSEMVEAEEGVELAGTAARGDLALQKLQKMGIDVVLLSMEAHKAEGAREGLDTLREIRRSHDHVSVAILCNVVPQTANARADALRMGAVDFIEKPEGVDPKACRAALEVKIRRVLKSAQIRQHLGPGRPLASPSPVAAVKVVPAPLAPLPVVAAPASPRPAPAAANGAGMAKAEQGPKPRYIDVVAIGISTGGPEALMKMVPALPRNLRVPIVLVQHMPPLFTASLAEELDRRSAISVKEGADGEPLKPGTLFIAPGGRHMIVRSVKNPATAITEYSVGLNDGPPENSCRPAVDVLFRSVGEEYSGNVLAVVMTGMGSDGCEGVRDMQRKGVYCITQAADSCVVYGMPFAVDEAGLSDESVPLERLAARIASLVDGGKR